MLIQVNSNNNIQNDNDLSAQVESVVQSNLERFEDYLTRVEVHLGDENSSKGGENDKRCMMEARLEGRPPIAVTNLSGELMDAVNGAASKLQRALDSEIGKLRDSARR